MSYGRGDAVVHAIAGVDVDLVAGELLAIMGASGSGKTTLLHLLAGLARVDSGTIWFGERELTSLPDGEVTALRARHIGVVFQSYNLMPTLSALDNVALPLVLTGVGRAKARAVALHWLNQVEMGQRAARRTHQLSGGEQQRVAVARALVSDPQVLLADEPTGNLDRKNVRAVCRLMRDVGARDGRAVAVVTHDPVVAADADRVIVLADGRVADRFSRQAVNSVEELAMRCLQVAEAGV